MESEDIESLRLASSYQSMSDSLAYRHLIGWLETECKKEELTVSGVPVSEKESWSLHFLSWQRLVQVTQSIKNIVEDQCKFKELTEKETANERPDASEFSSGGFDTSLRGYQPS